MSQQDDTWENLDSQFDHHLVDMKPHFLKVPNRSVACGSGVTGRKNRNMYAWLLLHMLRRGVLEAPFTHKPEAGLLKTLPTYMSIYFDEPLHSRPVEKEPCAVPEWVCGELQDSCRKTAYEEKLPPGPKTSSPLRKSNREEHELIQMPWHHREKSTLLSPIRPRSAQGNTSSCVNEEQEREAELVAKVLEVRHQEEKLQLQQRHDSDVQKILDRKNAEMNEVKSAFRKKQLESDEIIRKLEKKVQSLVRESQVIRENKEKQISELKKLLEQSADSQRNESEKKLHAAMVEMEQEKSELQKKHTENIQGLLEDTNQRLAKMEAEYTTQAQTMDHVVRELETRVKQLSTEVENGSALRKRLTQEKSELEIQIAGLDAELQEDSRRIVLLQHEKEQLSKQHEETLHRLQVKHEADLSLCQKEHTLSAAKASEAVEDLERTVAQLRQCLQDRELQKKQQLQDQENRFQNELVELRHKSEKKALKLQTELEKEKTDAKNREACLQREVRDRDQQLMDQGRQAEVGLQNLRTQMDKVEEDLTRSKALREKQSKEFFSQLQEVKQRYEQQIVELKLQHEQEKTYLLHQHNTEKDSLTQDHKLELQSLDKESRASMIQHEAQIQKWKKSNEQRVLELELQLQAAREELLQAHGQRKQQLVEIGLLREEERQRTAQEQEAALGRLRSEMERARHDLERTHAAERELALEKANSRLMKMEKEYNQRLAKSAQMIAELQTSLCSVREEAKHTQQNMERRLQDASALWKEERRKLDQDSDRTNKATQQKVEALQKQLHATEKKLMIKEMEHQEQLTKVWQECELRLKGLMPAELRQELEGTITSLQAQVNFLQKRAALLQEDLNARREHTSQLPVFFIHIYSFGGNGRTSEKNLVQEYFI
ncbi:centrosomal protein of 112 kDa isoform X2 [Denticeps clupeoides]|uniref:centrosomal protein of 112 kDa isoform X2 n=1 Tax=Denticeps clupeoides TaxID=299321 RepID=UPI0010A37E0D|nr:centrosomal protein of 112 kDa isoform X2 [Denticeps clupeoides]